MRPRVEVATQRVEVPVVWRTIPMVPEALRPSRKAPLRARSVMVVVAIVEVPVKVLVLFTRKFCTVRRVPSNAKLLESMSRPPVVRYGTRPVVKPEIARLVVVALVVVELVPLAFAKRSVPVKVGLFENTARPPPAEPVSSVNKAASCAEVVKAAAKPRVEVADQVGTPPTTDKTSPVVPIARLAKVFAPDAKIISPVA